MSRITDYTELSSPSPTDVVPIVDVSDPTMSPDGTTKKITIDNLVAGIQLVVSVNGQSGDVTLSAAGIGADPSGSAAAAQSAAEGFATAAVGTETSRAEAAETALAANSLDWVNAVSQYGADPAGATDSTTAIQSALNAATPGQVVYLPTGVYLYSSSLTIPNGVALYGDSQSFGIPIANYGAGGLPLQGTILKASGSFANPNSATGTVLMTQGSGQGGGQRLQGISIDCSGLPNGNNLHGIYIQNSTACVTLRDVTVYGGSGRVLGGDCLHCVAAGGSPPDLLNIAFCHFAAAAGYGVSMSGVADSYVTATESTANGLGGWNIINGNNTRFTGCKGETSINGPGWLFTAFSGFTGIVHLNACTSQSNFGDGFRFTGAGTGTYQAIACSSDADGLNGGSGGGSFAGLNVSSFAGIVLADGFNTRLGSSPVSPQYGVSMTSSNTLKVDNAVLAGATAPTNDGGGNTVFQIGLGAGLLSAVGDTAYQGSEGLARLPGNTSAALSLLTQTGNGSASAAPAWQTPSAAGVAALAGAAFTGATSVQASSATGGLLIVANAHTTPSSPSVQLAAATAADLLLGMGVTGDANPRFQVDSNGKMQWGTGAGAVDTALSRTQTGTLTTNSLRVSNFGSAGNILNVLNTNTGVPSAANVQLAAHNAADPELGILVTGDTQMRLMIDSNGKLNWGPGGSTASDTSLARSAANALTTGHLTMTAATAGSVMSVINASSAPTSPNAIFTAQGAGDSEIGLFVSGDTQPRLLVDSNGKHSWGPGGSTAPDTILQRVGVGVLQTNGRFTVSAGGSASPLFRVVNSTSAPATPSSSLEAAAAADLVLGAEVTGDTVYRLTVDSNGKHQWGPGGSTAADTNLYRVGAGALQTDQSFQAAGYMQGQRVLATGLTGATAASRYVGATTSGAPVSGTFNTGDYVVDQTGTFWVCTAAGTPGSWASPSNENDNWTAADSGYLAWNYDFALLNTGSAPTLGAVNLIRVNIRKTISVSNILLLITSAGSGLTTGQNFAGLISSAGALIATSADQTVNWGSTGIRTSALTGAPFVLTAGSFVWVAFVVNSSSTASNFARLSATSTAAANAGLTSLTTRWATNGTATTALASITPSSNASNSNTFLVALT